MRAIVVSTKRKPNGNRRDVLKSGWSRALHAARGAPGADLVGVLAVVVGGVGVDDSRHGLARLPARGGDAVGGLDEVFVRAVQLEQEIGDLAVVRGGGEARVPGVHVVVADALGDRALAAGEAVERRHHLTM